MPLNQDDLNAIQSLLLPLEDRVIDLEKKMNAGFDEMHQNFDHLFKQNETRETEYLVISNQIKELEIRVSKLEKRTA